jgi:hypothetical protein
MAEQGVAQSKVQDMLCEQAPFEEAELLGWTVIAEWKTREGERKLARLNSSDASHWQLTGYLHEALFGEEDRWSESASTAN